MSKTQSTVEYREVQGHPGYVVGNDGSVWTRWTTKNKWQHGCEIVMTLTWRPLTTTPVNGGYRQVGFYAGKCKRSIRKCVHQIVLEAFVGPCPKGMVGRHFPDRNPANNNISNLSWGTFKQNQADRIFHGTDVRGEAVGGSKLTKDKVSSIISRLGRRNCASLAREFGVCNSTIKNIKKKKTWRHVWDEVENERLRQSCSA